ncbi:MAG: hypothetical protein IPQ19_15300 [Bacteroidetes bacterium]|nr:hypothetical protein [Bacteroidota bacterium]
MAMYDANGKFIGQPVGLLKKMVRKFEDGSEISFPGTSLEQKFIDHFIEDKVR